MLLKRGRCTVCDLGRVEEGGVEWDQTHFSSACFDAFEDGFVVFIVEFGRVGGVGESHFDFTA